MIAAAGNAILRIFLGPECAACGVPLERPLDGPVCAACWRAVPRLTPPLCDRCGDALPHATDDRLCWRCHGSSSAIERAGSAGMYQGSMRAIVHAFKYEGRRALAEPLAAMMREAGGDLLADADAVVPVPLSSRRAFARGFNQADDLARLLGLPVWRLLGRRHGPPQAGLSASERAVNVRDAYALGWAARWPLAPSLRGATVVLVDDVMTTGTTLEACARVLATAGARRVRALTAARAVTTVATPP